MKKYTNLNGKDKIEEVLVLEFIQGKKTKRCPTNYNEYKIQFQNGEIKTVNESWLFDNINNIEKHYEKQVILFENYLK